MELLQLQELPGDYVALSTTLGVTKDWWDTAPFHQRAEARALAIGRSTRRAVLLGAAAARVHGLWVFRPRSGPEIVRLGLPSGTVPPRADWLPGSSYVRGPVGETELVRGVRVSSRARTVVDIARWEGWIRGFVAAESFLRDGGLIRELQDACLGLGRVRGIADARRAVRMAGGQSESPYEALAFGLLTYAEVPVRQQVRLLDDARVDLMVGAKLVVEIDGAVKYDGSTYGVSPHDAVLAERRREVRLHNAGFTVVRFMAAEVEKDPESFIATVKRWHLTLSV